MQEIDIESKNLTARQYSSFLLRFWLTNEPTQYEADEQSTNLLQSLVLQIQHLQTGTQWRVTNLEDLNSLLSTLVENKLKLPQSTEISGTLDS